MKSAKEWAADVVDERGGALILHHIGGGRSVVVDVDVDASELDEVIDDARAIIERLVERAQADARAPLLELLFESYDALRDIHRYAADGSLEERYCERLLPKIEEALKWVISTR